MDTCSYLEQMDARIRQLEADKYKLEAEKEVRAWIDVARELISKDLKRRFPNAFPQITGNIYWKDWVSLARTNTHIYEEISKSANSLFEFKQTDGEKLVEFYIKT